METAISADELKAEIEPMVNRFQLGAFSTLQELRDTITSVELMLVSKAKPARLSRQVLFGRLDDVQTFFGYLVYWPNGLVILDPASDYIDYFGIVDVENTPDNKIKIHINSLFDPPDQYSSHKIQIDFRYGSDGTYATILPTIGGKNQGGCHMFPEHAYTMLTWFAVMLNLRL